MTEHNEFRAYLENASVGSSNGPSVETACHSDQLYIDVPPPLPPPIPKVSLGYDPMDRIRLEGQAYRGLASGHQPWWVIVSSWFVLGVPSLSAIALISFMTALTGEFFWLVLLCVPAVLLSIVWRGTYAKFARRHKRHS
ncbi:MAG: hypothetical protein AAFO06_18260 [Cyanobacteria bacterium J06597_16]